MHRLEITIRCSFKTRPPPSRRRFFGGFLSSDGGATLLRQLDRGLGRTHTLCASFHEPAANTIPELT